jgi:hypothetical protein
VGAGQLLQLAAGMRMTTDVRRAVFVAVMGSEDCAEACEKLLRLPLKVCIVLRTCGRGASAAHGGLGMGQRCMCRT